MWQWNFFRAISTTRAARLNGVASVTRAHTTYKITRERARIPRAKSIRIRLFFTCRQVDAPSKSPGRPLSPRRHAPGDRGDDGDDDVRPHTYLPSPPPPPRVHGELATDAGVHGSPSCALPPPPRRADRPPPPRRHYLQYINLYIYIRP